MKRKILIPIDQANAISTKAQASTEQKANQNPVTKDLNQPNAFIPTPEEKERIDMTDETFPTFDPSLFSGEKKEEDTTVWSLFGSESSTSKTNAGNKTPASDFQKSFQEYVTEKLASNMAKLNQTTPAATTTTPSVKATATTTSRTGQTARPNLPKGSFQNLFKFHNNGQLTRGPIASGQHLVGKDQQMTRLNGEPMAYVHYNQMHLHGAILQMGSSASNAQQPEGYDPALGVTGFLPQAIEFLQKAARSVTALKSVDQDGRPYQFGVITVLGGADHDKLTNGFVADPTSGLVTALERLGLADVKNGYHLRQDLRFVKFGVQVSPVVFNHLGYITGLEVTFSDTETYGSGSHYIYLHRANDIGGGKSDHSLAEGRTQFQAKALSDEFGWWQAALELAGGKIGTVETTLGGTARVGRYALLHAKVARSLFSKDAVETILLDDADEVKNNYGSMAQEYRANFATTLLRAAFGTLSKRLNGVRLDLANRFDLTQRRLRQLTCIESVLRTHFPGVPALDPMFMDLSDERTAIASQENITQAKQFTIHDPVQNNPAGPWALNRRTRVTTASSFSFGEVSAIALGQRNDETLERAREMFASARALATSSEDILEAGGFCILDVFVPVEAMANPEVLVTKDMIETVSQVLANAFKQAGSDKVLVHCHKVRKDLLPHPDRVYIRLTEDQPAHNMLLVSTHDAGVREKRTILTDPNLDVIEDRHFAHVYAYARLFQQLIEGHERSNYRFAEEDASLLRAYYRHFYSNTFGSQPNLILGGSNRPLKK
ncbi:MAG: hypothetical protein ACPHFV_05130 [Poseidonia sp.]